MTTLQQPTLAAINSKELSVALCRKEFYFFVQEFWEEIIPEEPVWNWHIKMLCDELQEIAERVFRNEPSPYDLIVNIPPGTTKSTITSIMFPAWTWTRMPSARHICGTHGFDLGQDLSRRCRQIVESKKYQTYFSETRLVSDQNTKSYFIIAGGGYRKSVTVGGKSPVGFHAHFLIVDDPINPDAAMSVSEADIKHANGWMMETLPTRKVDKKLTPTIMIMQRLHQNDPSGHRLRQFEAKRGAPVRHMSLPADIHEGYEVKPLELERHYKDGLLDPVRIGRDVLAIERGNLGEFAYAGQYGQSPVPRGGGMFKTEKLNLEHIPARLKFIRMMRYWDKAGTQDGGAFTVGAKLAIDEDWRIWILDIIRGQWSVDRREQLIRQAAKMDGKRTRIGLEQEPGSAGKESATATVRKLLGYRVVSDKVTGDKESRAEPIAIQWNMGNVYAPPNAPWLMDLLEELKYFPNSTYKDQADAISGAFNLLSAGLKWNKKI